MNKEALLSQWKHLKGNLENLVSQKGFTQLSETVKGKLHDAQQDLSKFIDGDIGSAVKNLQKQSKNLEASIEKMIKVEVTKAQQYLAKQKKEFAILQKKMEAAVKNQKKPVKSASKSKPAAKAKTAMKAKPVVKANAKASIAKPMAVKAVKRPMTSTTRRKA